MASRNLDEPSWDGTTPLMVAASQGDLEGVKELVKAGARIFAGNIRGETALRYASQDCRTGNRKEVVKYLKREMERRRCELADDPKKFPLHMAAKDGNLLLVVTLLGEGAKVNSRDRKNRTPFEVAVINGHFNEALLFMTRLSRSEKWALTFLPVMKRIRDVCISSEKREILSSFLQIRALHLRNESNSIVMNAVLAQSNAFLHCCLEVHADQVNAGQVPPLFVAVNLGNVFVTDLLLKFGADVTLLNECNETVLDIARENRDGAERVHMKRAFGKLVSLLKTATARVVRDALEAQDYEKCPLNLAATIGDLELVKSCVEKGCYLHKRDENGKTPIELAAQHRLYEVMEYLMEQHRQTDPPEFQWDIACRILRNFRFRLRLLMSLGTTYAGDFPSNLITSVVNANYNLHTRCSSLLFRAVYNGDVLLVRIALTEAPESLDATNIYGSSPLMMAAYFGDKNVAQILVGANANVFATDDGGRTALDLAMIQSTEAPRHKTADYEAIVFLLRSEVERYSYYLKINDDPSVYPLHVAAKNGDDSVVRDLLKRGHDVNSRDIRNKTALDVALENGQSDVIFTLIDSYIDDDDHTNKWVTDFLPLMNKIRSLSAEDVRRRRFFRLLLEARGICRLCPDASVLHFVITTSDTDLLLAALETYPDQLNFADREGDTPLMWAAQFGELDMVKALVAEGADVHATNDDGHTALDWADGTADPFVSEEHEDGREKVAAWLLENARSND